MVKKIRPLTFMKVGKNFDRVNPITFVLIISVILLVIGLLVKILQVLAWVGGLVLLVYIGAIMAGIVNKFKK